MKLSLLVIPALLYIIPALTGIRYNASNYTEFLSVVQEDSTKEVFTIVEEMPQFTGGNEAMNAYFVKNIKYPEQAKKDGIKGRVFVTFIVDETGDVTKVKVLRGVSPELDAEALRVVSEMPNWIPGKQRGEKVAVQYNLPIDFKL